MRRTCLVIALWFGCGAAAATADSLNLFFADARGIERHDRRDAGKYSLLYGAYSSLGVTADANGFRLFWSETIPTPSFAPPGTVYRGDRFGSPSAAVARFLTAPAGVALDNRSQRVFWSDLGSGGSGGGIFTANLDGTDRREILSGPQWADIAGLALDPLNSKLYFSFQNPLSAAPVAGGIARIDLDGKNPEVVVGALVRPAGLAVDPVNKLVYWADPRSVLPSDHAGVIEMASLDGTERRIVLGGLSDPFGVALDALRGDLYWTDTGTGKIQRTSASGMLPFFEDVLVGLDRPTGLALAMVENCDANGDSFVGAADYAVWAAQFGQTGPHLPGDFDRSGSVGSGDYTMWAANVDGPSSVPEPATGMLALFGLAGLLVSRRRTTRQ